MCWWRHFEFSPRKAAWHQWFRLPVLGIAICFAWLGFDERVAVPFPVALISRWAFVILSAVLLALVLAAGRLHPRWLVAAGLSTYAAVATLLLIGCLKDQWVWLAIDGETPYEFVMPMPGSRVYHRHSPDFDVVYGIGDDGWRLTPDPLVSRGDVLVLGCSYTLGHGVADDENYPYLLGRDAWPNYKVCNRGYEFSGTTRAYDLLRERLQRSPPPAAVLYGWIWDHQNRNVRAEEGFRWDQSVEFDLELASSTDDFVIRGSLRPVNDRTSRQGHAFAPILAAGLIDAMRRECDAQGVPFVLCLYRMPNIHPADAVPELARQRQTRILDLRDLGGFFPKDGHPLPSWHRDVADRIAGMPDLEFLRRVDPVGREVEPPVVTP